MNEYAIAIATGLFITIIAAAAIGIFYLKYRKDKATRNVVDDMNAVMEVCDQSPMAKLRSIEAEIDALAEVADTIRTDLNSVSSTTREIQSAIDDSMEEYSYGSLFYRIADIASSVSSTRSAISDIESRLGGVSSELGDVKSAIQNSSSSSDYYNLSSKLDDIASNMSYIQSSISSIEYKMGS